MGANMGPGHLLTAATEPSGPARFSESRIKSLRIIKLSSVGIASQCPRPMAQSSASWKLARRNNNKCHDMNSTLAPPQRTTSNSGRSTQAITSRITNLLLRAASQRGRRGVALISALFACTLLVLAAGNPRAQVAAHPEVSGAPAQAAETTRAALEAELNAIFQAEQQQQQQQDQDQDQDESSKLVSEAIISRLMLGNMSDLGNGRPLPGGVNDLDGAPQPSAVVAVEPSAASESTGGIATDDGSLPSSAADALRFRKVLSLLQNYELMHGDGGAVNGGQAFSQYPVLPSSQAATIKRASTKMGQYLRQQQQSGQHSGQRPLASYGRVNSYDFGLGKRPDSSVSGNILRFGDSASAGGHMAAVSGASGLGKRPSAHRYDFGLGKRVASPAYPRYDFGLGKRAPSRLRYDFGLGRR